MGNTINIYERIFFNLFSSFSRTNKSIPEWSTIICLSVLLELNLVSLGVLLDFNITGYGRTSFVLIMVGIIVMHWLYFLKNGRILKKFKKLKPRVNTYGKIIAGIYSYGTFALLFYSLKLDWTYYFIIIVVFGLVTLSAFIFGSKPIEFK